MNQVNFTWIGPTGVNPLRGYVVNGQPVKIKDDKIKAELLRCRLIEPITKNSNREVENDGEEKAGQTAESEAESGN